MVKRACRTVDVDPSRCVVVGDIGSDVEAAEAAGAVGILVPTPATRVEEIDSAHRVCPDLDPASREVAPGRWVACHLHDPAVMARPDAVPLNASPGVPRHARAPETSKGAQTPDPIPARSDP